MTQQVERPVAIVTGGRRGIGLGIAIALAKAGYNIVITGVGAAQESRDVVDELRGLGVDAVYLQADVSDVSRHDKTVRAVLSSFGRIDCLVNNAGMAAVVRGDFLGLLPENFDTIMATNLKGTVFFTQAVVKAMLVTDAAHRPRSIINITSVSAEASSPERLDYCISKAGLAAFSQGLALRLADSGIAVFEVRPGIIRTDMTVGVTSKYDALIESGLVPMRRWGEAEDLGKICAALASGDFGFATGTVINADGGLSIPRL
ncbi:MULTISPECIES: 3-ketoacyl-ACP reductase [unclassified Rhizobium]|uniref:3-ketoacyl-ACP reductase n=1 Tax=unclassified Rhizobium TaxID=2613769 RepID=UPI001050B6AD|nr:MULTISPECIES: 3-ketoacyl-ACP reductase [unclassified Rhizobium]MBB3397471.1 NAD(P)-dependent dehydrogenase (short-subunit alcohol dehydrogenase family) [Rhizobium sp. BK060]TCM70644.1 NAD(P)-dependent dehydrogenase (short-subunit alcohol dehydrogenase family) [Rhizobium sp. BK068]